MKVLSAVALLGLGAGLFLFLPENSDNEPPVASAAASAPETTAAPDESLCDKQAWPYVDQRCAKRVEAARGTRQVRIVTDKGHSATTVTPLPIVEPKPAPAPTAPIPAIAQTDRPIGPPAVPAVSEPPPQEETVATAPQPPAQNPAPKAAAGPPPTVQVTVAPANHPPFTKTVPQEAANPPADTRSASLPPAAASTAPMAPGSDAFAEDSSRKSKLTRAAERAEKRAAEKAAKREAKRRKPIEEDDGGVPEDVTAAVKSAPSAAGGQKSRATRRAVPDEVVQAVEEAAAETSGRRGRRTVTIGSPNGGQRIYLVPREEASGW